jgi:hypothetical protein
VIYQDNFGYDAFQINPDNLYKSPRNHVNRLEDIRLAIELGGDNYHTLDRWADDYRRQQILERVGSKFWRCWGQVFILIRMNV